MSFNRYEQTLCDYIEERAEEKRYWMDQVRELVSRGERRSSTALMLNDRLWEYFQERARHEASLRNLVAYEGPGKVSMLNLSEYWLRMWAPPAKRKA